MAPKRNVAQESVQLVLQHIDRNAGDYESIAQQNALLEQLIAKHNLKSQPKKGATEGVPLTVKSYRSRLTAFCTSFGTRKTKTARPSINELFRSGVQSIDPHWRVQFALDSNSGDVHGDEEDDDGRASNATSQQPSGSSAPGLAEGNGATSSAHITPYHGQDTSPDRENPARTDLPKDAPSSSLFGQGTKDKDESEDMGVPDAHVPTTEAQVSAPTPSPIPSPQGTKRKLGAGYANESDDDTPVAKVQKLAHVASPNLRLNGAKRKRNLETASEVDADGPATKAQKVDTGYANGFDTDGPATKGGKLARVASPTPAPNNAKRKRGLETANEVNADGPATKVQKVGPDLPPMPSSKGAKHMQSVVKSSDNNATAETAATTEMSSVDLTSPPRSVVMDTDATKRGDLRPREGFDDHRDQQVRQAKGRRIIRPAKGVDVTAGLPGLDPKMLRDETRGMSQRIENFAVGHFRGLQIKEDAPLELIVKPRPELEKLYIRVFGAEWLKRAGTLIAAGEMSALDFFESCTAAAVYEGALSVPTPWQSPNEILAALSDLDSAEHVNRILQEIHPDLHLHRLAFESCSRHSTDAAFHDEVVRPHAEKLAREYLMVINNQLEYFQPARPAGESEQWRQNRVTFLTKIFSRALIFKTRTQAAPEYYDMPWPRSGEPFCPERMMEIREGDERPQEVLRTMSWLIVRRAKKDVEGDVICPARVYTTLSRN